MILTYTDIEYLSNDISFQLKKTSKHVAVLTNGSFVEAIFTNQYANHAEELAISYYLSNNYRIKRPRIYIVRISPVNRMSRPCRHCCSLLKRFPQIRVFYSNTQGNLIEEIDYDTNHITHRRVQMGYCRVCS